MTVPEMKELSIRRLKAQAIKEELIAKKIELEVNKYIEDEKKPFYKKSSAIKVGIAGVSISLIFAAYIQYIFIPTQNRLNQKAETAEFKLQQNLARHSAQIAKLELIQEQIKADAKLAGEQLQAAISSLEEAREQNTQLKSSLTSLSKTVLENEDIINIQDSIIENKIKIDRKIAQARESEVKIAGINDAVEAVTASSPITKGWIYIGYFKDGGWLENTIEISTIRPKVDQLYKVVENVNIRDTAPKFSLLGYKFGNALGFLLPGQIIKVKKIDTVGLSKVWAEIETVNE